MLLGIGGVAADSARPTCTASIIVVCCCWRFGTIMRRAPPMQSWGTLPSPATCQIGAGRELVVRPEKTVPAGHKA